MRLLNLSREKWRDETTLQTHAANRRLDGGAGGVHRHRYYAALL
jgi:hypothetical protein